jgi:serine/threonine protein kinase
MVPAPATNATETSSASLCRRLEVAVPVIQRNGWATTAQLEHMSILAQQVVEPLPAAGRSVLGTFLLERKLLTKEQVNELETIVKVQVFFADFTLHKKIGSGGMGTVFLATHSSTGREVALKTINTRLADEGDFVSRFVREAKALSSVRHPYVAEIIGSGEANGHCWLAMEFIDGPSLMSLLKDHKVLPEPYALHLVRQVAEGLQHVWDSAGMVHRDIKPENILVLRDRGNDQMFPLTDTAKLIDFGLVKTNQEDERLTQTGMTIGTPLYMSPEQVRGDKLDCRSDVYGLGTTLYHLLTGSTPFIGSSPGAIMSAHLTQAVPDPGARVPSLGQATRTLVMTAMAKDPDQRFLTFSGFIAALDKALAAVEHKTSEFPKLLRKPMVLKAPTATNRRSDQDSGRIAKDQAASKPQTTTSISRPTTQTVKRPPSTHFAQPPTTTSMKPATVRLTNTGAGPIVPAPLPPAEPNKNSAAYADDIHESAGVGLLPWLALAVAVGGFVAYWIFIRS